MDTVAKISLIIIIVCFSIVLTPINKIFFNKQEFILNKIDENTKYENIKQVEDTARSMIASYESDKMMYLQYQETNKEWAEQAKIRANKTAIKYNEYFLKNSFLWGNNIPKDIKEKLEILE